MKCLGTAAGAVALALLTFFQFPGHTWLHQDTQIYVPILEHLRDPAVLGNDILAQDPHVRFTIYDETARFFSALTGFGFREVLEFEQIVTRALGIWGLFLCGMAMFKRGGQAPALLVAAVCSLGITIAGPQVLTVEYEPTPRAFALPLLVCGIGLAAHRRYLGAGLAGACAFLYHPPTSLPFWGIYLLLVFWPGKRDQVRSRLWGLVPLAAAVAVLLVAARFQGGDGEPQAIFGRIAPLQEQLQRLRAPYIWISLFPRPIIVHYLVLAGLALAAYARIRREIPVDLRFFLLGLPLMGLASMPISWLLLERLKWILIPQLQPLRTLLFVALATQFLTASAGVLAATGRRVLESAVWFAAAFLLTLQPVVTAPLAWQHAALALGLGALAAAAVRISAFPRLRWAPALALAAFFAIPAIGGIANYPRMETPELAQLVEWARSYTAKDSVFLFADAGRAPYPGMFRSEALRAVYVDWKGGGQVNFLRTLAEQWWSRWRQTGAGRFKPSGMETYGTLGIDYVVLRTPHRAPAAAVFENSAFTVYRVR